MGRFDVLVVFEGGAFFCLHYLQQLAQSINPINEEVSSSMMLLKFKMEAITSLNKDESRMLQEMLRHYHIPPSTALKAQKNYRELRKHQNQDMQSAVKMRAAILMAQIGETVQSVRGVAIRGMSLSLNQMLREQQPVARIAKLLAYHHSHCRHMEANLKEDLGQTIKEISFGALFMEKFQRAMTYFDFKQRREQGGEYLKLFNSFTWLLFVHLHSELRLTTDEEEDYLLISVLYLTVRYAFDYMSPKSIEVPHRSQQKALITSILNTLFDIFLIAQPSIFKRITALVDDHFESLLGSVIRSNNQTHPDFLSPNLLLSNYQRLDAHYLKNKDPHTIDYRHFLPNRNSTLTPNKNFSQRVKSRTPRSQAPFHSLNANPASHRILTFDEEEVVPLQEMPRISDVKLPSNVKVSPSFHKVPLVVNSNRVNPVHSSMLREVRQSRTVLDYPANGEEVLTMIEGMLERREEASVAEKAMLVYEYYLLMTMRYLRAEEVQINDLNAIHSAFLLHSLALVLSRGDEDACDLVKELREEVIVTGHYLWLTNSYLAKHNNLPLMAKRTLQSLQEIFISQTVWEQQSSVEQIVNAAIISSSSDTTTLETLSIRERNMLDEVEAIVSWSQSRMEKVLRHLLHPLSPLPLSQLVQQCQQTFIDTICRHQSLLIDHKLDQIVLCVLYVVLRREKTSTLFKDIISAYQHTYCLSEPKMKGIISQIETEDGEINIIQFYNRVFLPTLTSCHSPNPQQENQPSNQHSPQKKEQQEPVPRRIKTQQVPTQIMTFKKEELKEQAPKGRNSTKIRSRPNYFNDCLKTQKGKSPLTLR